MNAETKRVIIVGASSGLGRQLAIHYAANGCRVGVCARRESALKELAGQFPENVIWDTVDVVADDAVDRFDRLIDKVGGADIIIYAAGCGWNNPMLDKHEDDRTVDTNVVGYTRIINAAFNYFADRKETACPKGQICAITSIAGTKGIGISTTYSATKRYQWTYLEALAQLASVRRVNIDITDIRPGFIDTALLDTSAHKYPMLMSVPYATRRIVRAIDRHRRVAYVDWRWKAVVMGWKLIPRCLWIKLRLNI